MENIKLEFVLYSFDSTQYSNMIDKFDCGNENINKFLKNLDKNKYPEEYVIHLVIDKNKNNLVAYYALSATALISKVECEVDGNIKTIYDGKPAIEIKMFAVDKGYQNLILIEEDESCLLADDILMIVKGDIYRISQESIGVEYIILHSVPDAIGFYERNYFVQIKDKTSMVTFNNISINDCQLMVFTL